MCKGGQKVSGMKMTGREARAISLDVTASQIKISLGNTLWLRTVYILAYV